MKNGKEEWINNVLNSRAELGKLIPSDHLQQKIVDAISVSRETVLISFNQLKFGIAAAVTLVMLNVGVFAYISSKKADSKVAQQYFESYNLNLY